MTTPLEEIWQELTSMKHIISSVPLANLSSAEPPMVLIAKAMYLLEDIERKIICYIEDIKAKRKERRIKYRQNQKQTKEVLQQMREIQL